MGCQVEIWSQVHTEIDSWNLPPEVKERLFETIYSDLSSRLSNYIGQIEVSAPVVLRRYPVAIIDTSGSRPRLHNFVFLVNVCKHRRIIVSGNHR